MGLQYGRALALLTAPIWQSSWREAAVPGASLAQTYLAFRLPLQEGAGSRSLGNEGRPGFDPWVGKIPWRRERQPTPVFWPGEFHGQRSLAGYSPRGCKESDMTEQLSLHFTFFVGGLFCALQDVCAQSHCRVIPSFSGLTLPRAVTAKHVSGYCQMFPGVVTVTSD